MMSIVTDFKNENECGWTCLLNFLSALKHEGSDFDWPNFLSQKDRQVIRDHSRILTEPGNLL